MHIKCRVEYALTGVGDDSINILINSSFFVIKIKEFQLKCDCKFQEEEQYLIRCVILGRK